MQNDIASGKGLATIHFLQEELSVLNVLLWKQANKKRSEKIATKVDWPMPCISPCLLQVDSASKQGKGSEKIASKVD
jgi:hypothetical protein